MPLEDPYSYAVIDPSGAAVGITTLMDIRPGARSVEVGHIVYSPALQRTPRGRLLTRLAWQHLRLEAPPLQDSQPGLFDADEPDA